MKNKVRALQEVFANALSLRKIIDYQVYKQLCIHTTSENSKRLNEIGITDKSYDNNEIIVSLTTYSRRIYQVHLVIESLLEQTLKPNRIILWLAQEEFKNIDDLPLNLSRLCNRGLQIEFCDDLRSYKKLIPALQKYPDSIIITADDDILYPDDFVERLYKEYRKDSNKIYFYRGHRMSILDGYLQPYRAWELETQLEKPSLLNFPTGCGGVLYTKKLLDDDVLDVETFTKLAPTADDVWFKAMSLKKKILCEQIKLECPFREKFIFLDAMDDMGLAKTNLIQNKNDEQIIAVFKKYGLYSIICTQ